MLFFGSNIFIASRELGINITQLGTYALGDKDSVTVYDYDDISFLLNVVPDYFSFYRAWFHVPGFRFHDCKEHHLATVNKNRIVVPHFSWDRLELKSADDIFEYVRRRYPVDIGPALFDMTFLIADINEMDINKLCEKYAREW